MKVSGLNAIPDRWVAIIAAILGLVAFFWLYDPGLASAYNAFWQNPKNDMAAMTAGYLAFLQAPFGFPPTLVSTLTEKPVSIVYTDSIPWLALVLKFSGLGQAANPLGLFLLISYPLQAVGMVAVLRAMGERRPTFLLLGAVFALLFPPWIARQFGHIALSGHWILLLTLATAIAIIREGFTRKRIVHFALLGALATGVHAYHLVPMSALFGAAGLAEILQRRPKAWVNVAIAAVAFAAAVGLSALFLGYAYGRGPTGGAGALGLYSMNVLSPWYPQGSQFAGQAWNGQWFTKVVDPSGGAQLFEGFQYLGLGGMLLSAILAVVVIRIRRLPTRAQVKRWAPLAAACIVLTLWAIGWEVWVGSAHVASIPRPEGALAEIFGGFRAYGRFFWIVGYLIVVCGILWASRLSPRIGMGLLAVLILLQAWDLQPLRSGIRANFQALAPSYPADWARNPALAKRQWVFAPTYFCATSPQDARVMMELALVAVRQQGSVNTFPTARSNDRPCGEPIAGLGNEAAPGDRRVTVVTGLSNPSVALQQVAWRTDCYRFSQGLICGQGLEPLGLQKAAAADLTASAGGAILSVRADQLPKPGALAEGWAEFEPGGKGVWSLAPKARIRLDIPARAAAGKLTAEIMAIGYTDEPARPQRVRVSAGGQILANLIVEPSGFGLYKLELPAGIAAAGPLMLDLDLPDARKPPSNDPRLLGIAVQSIRVVPSGS